ncbi:MAG: deoxyribodipyrimidine photo-lyase [Candidatus Woesearchaeota archaeon]|nr:deoxyribodipyrimidine photo-lyase [Candidatus Woesearchaeota archaeon]
MLTLHIFRRDLRVHDNTALRAALAQGTVVPCFILDERQLEENEYHSANCVQFMFDSLRELDEQLKALGGRLYLFKGIAEDVVAQLKEHVENITFNRDYTPFSQERDAALAKLLQCTSFPDALLHEPEDVLKSDGQPYTVYTPFMKKARTLQVTAPQSTTGTFHTEQLPGEVPLTVLDELLPERNEQCIPGGRSHALAVLENIGQYLSYVDTRNFPAQDATTHLSAHNKFGTVSVREVYHAIKDTLGEEHILINELIWRDFFTHIAFHFPHVFGGPFKKKFERVQWKNSKQAFEKWCTGTTGFPIVDAGMRELNTTGFMHNRVRMIVASFLTKDLQLDWRLGEQYFAQQLVDYDPCVNNGNWQWAASTGCDAQPWFRIFNPWLQQQKFDPACEYIKQWVPELADVPSSTIHNLANETIEGYPSQMVDHKTAREATLAMFKSALG